MTFLNISEINKIDKVITDNAEYCFNISETGLYLIEIIASAKSWWQNLKEWRTFFNDDDLVVKIDGAGFPKLNGKRGLFDGEAAWNGNNLKGLKKINIFVMRLESGEHKIEFIADKNPYVESIKINKAETENYAEYIPSDDDKQAQDGNNRQWINLVFAGLPLKEIFIAAKAKKRGKDSDDIKLIIDGEIQQNHSSQKFKNWYWCGSLDNEKEKIFRKNVNLKEGLHYIEFWADRMPILNKIELNLQASEEQGDDQGEKTIKKYDQYHGISGKENYDRFDNEIIEAVDYWNNFFIKQEYPPNELLDYNLVKAIIYRESRVGYEIGGEIDVMQVGNEKDPALHTFNNDGWINPVNNIVAREYEIQNGVDEVLDYGGEAQVKIIQDSIYWGVRWLYHKAQGITNDKKRYWRSWKDAVLGYGPGTAEYVDYIWRVYKEGKDFNGKVENVLWIKTEEGFTVSKIMIGIGIILVAGFLMYCLNIKLLSKSSNEIVKGVSTLQEIYENVDKIFLNDLEIYKKGGIKYGDFFEDTLKECEKTGCIKQSVVYDKYKLIIKNMKDNKHFLSAMGSLSADNNFYLNDIDNDGENEIIFLIYDPLNRDHINISVIDKIDGKFELVEKKIKWGHSGHLAVLDLTGDLKPEIVSYISFGKGGESLFVCQYNYPEFKEIFKIRDFLYPEYTFSDMDNNGKMEIRVIGEEHEPLHDYRALIKRIYEYNPLENNFILINSETTEI